MSGADSPRVCVVVPCFNRADTVAEAIESVLGQGFRDLEVIAVDDGSTDGSRAVMAGIDDPRLRCLQNPGKGVSAARNFGAAASRAPWIAFQDSDDLWLPDKLEKQMARLEGSDCVAAYCGMAVKPDTDPATPVMRRYPDPAAPAPEGDILPALVRGSFLSTQMLVIRRDVFEAVGGFDEALHALVDWELMLRVAQRGPVACVDEDLVVQRMSPNSITRSSRKRLEAQEYILAKHAALLDRFPGARAHHHHRIAGAYRRAGEVRPALPHALRALRTAPFKPLYTLNLLRLCLRAVVRQGPAPSPCYRGLPCQSFRSRPARRAVGSCLPCCWRSADPSLPGITRSLPVTTSRHCCAAGRCSLETA